MSDELRAFVRQAVVEPVDDPPVGEIVDRARSRRTRRHALMAVAPVVVLIAALAALPHVGVQEVAFAPGSPAGPISVTLDRTVVPQGTDITATVRNTSDQSLEYEPPYGLERATGDGWEPQAWGRTLIALSEFQALAPGEQIVDRIVTWHLEPGRYRYSKTIRSVDGEDFSVSALFEVTAGAATDPAADPALLQGRTFVSVEVTRDGVPHELVPGTVIRVRFPPGEGPAWGSLDAGCNTLSGIFEITPERLAYSGGLETAMGCSGERHGQDRWVFAFFSTGASWRLEDGRLHLSGNGTTIVLAEVAETEESPGPEPEPESEPLPQPEPEPEPEPEPVQDPDALWDRSFVAVSITEGGQPRPLLPGTELHVEFERRGEGGVVRWTTGCNFQGGEVEITSERLHVSHIVGTDMGCEPEGHEQDRWTAAFFNANPYWRLDGARLWLRSGTTMIVLEERP